jgi:phosphoadenosine phosphosulfate reductase
LKQIVGHYDALIGSLRREEGSKRGVIPVVAVDDEMNLLRIHPIFAMSRRQMMARIEEREVVTNPLHQQGYPTVSCNRCTTPVVEGEEERAGRWRHLAGQTEYCHINPTDRASRKERAIELPDFLVAKLVG